MEGRAATGSTLCPDPPAVSRYDPLDRGESHAVARKFLLVVQSLKEPEELLRIMHVEASAVVASEEYCHVALCSTPAGLDASSRPLRCNFQALAMRFDITERTSTGSAMARMPE